MQFFPTAEGYVDSTRGKDSASFYNYVYQYKDHLGNVRVDFAAVVQVKGQPAVAQIKEENHYYAFGLKHMNYNMDYLEYQAQGGDIVLAPPPVTPTGKLPNNYKYNGKELQDELGLNMYDYGARNYDPAIGRWMNIDPLAEQFASTSPYVYCANNPVIFVDPDGMADDVFGNEIGSDGVIGELKESTASRRAAAYANGGGGEEDDEKKPGALRRAWNWIERKFGIGDGRKQVSEVVVGPASIVSTGESLGFEIGKGFLRGVLAEATIALSLLTLPVSDTPDFSYTTYSREGLFTTSDIRTLTKTRDYKDNKGIDGSYTITYSNGKKYHGKGPINRMVKSAIERMVFGFKVTSFDWAPSLNEREAYKAEYRRMQTDRTDVFPQGYMNPINYNVIQSKGYNYILQDGY